MATVVSNSVVAENVEIRHYRGDTFIRTLFFYQDAAKTIPQVVSTDTFKLNVVNKDLKSKSTPVLSFTMASGISLLTSNSIKLEKSSTQMSIRAGTYTYDLQQTKTDGTVITLLAGDFIIKDDRTV